jgi:response regulator RpfG family c-di-GMP phosphodiesterase
MISRILFVDDDENILAGYKRNLRARFAVSINSNPVDALEVLKKDEPYSVIVSDYKMPGMDGITFLSKAKQIAPDSVRMILTGFADINNAINAVNEGNVFRFLTKPITHDALINALNSGVEQYRLINAEKELLNKTLKGSIKVLIDILSAVNPTAFSHASSISRLARKVAERLKLESVWEIELAALLSQVGLVTIPEELLEKKMSGKALTDEENQMFNSHPKVGSDFLKNIPRLEEVSEAITYQTHRFDQMCNELGKSEKSKSTQMLAEIIKVCSDFNAYVKSGGLEPAVIEMMARDTGHYNPEVLTALEAEYSGLDRKYALKNLKLFEISSGMIIAQDIYDANNLIFLRKGMEITTVLKLRLLNLSKVKKVVEPIKVFVPTN